jgi:hypothetical protein
MPDPSAPPGPTPASLAEAAHAAFGAGDLALARERFDALLAVRPEAPEHHYMQGLTCKYLRDWPRSLHHNLRAIALSDAAAELEAERWNAAIAATALGDWVEARRQWIACGIDVPGDRGPIAGRFGVLALRLEPWGPHAETVFARRIDPVRAEIINIPLPDTGYRYGDLVLHDGAATGERFFHQSRVPVMNALQRLGASAYPTFAAIATCPAPADREALLAMSGPGIAGIEDWSDSLVHLCLRCSHGLPHAHEGAHDGRSHRDDADPWPGVRDIGIAAQGRTAAQRLLERWKAAGHGRRVELIEHEPHAPTPPPTCGPRWWLAPEDRDDDAAETRSSTDV